MVVRMRTTRSKTGHRRSHHALEDVRLSKCEHCGAAHLRHRVCLSCGYYRGKKILNVEELAVEKEKKRERRQARAQERAAEKPEEVSPSGEERESASADSSIGKAEAPAGKERPLSVEELSKR